MNGRTARIGLLIGVLYAVLAGFVVVRLATDLPHLRAGTVPDQGFSRRYVAEPWIPYVHILLGTVYLIGAPFQLSGGFRSASYPRHRRLGRLLATAAMASALPAVWLGLVSPWAGTGESSASLTFAVWFVACVVVAVRSIRAGDVVRHRRWMIRAFAVGTAIATIRLWVGLFTLLLVVVLRRDVPDLPERVTFGLSFWLAFACHVAFAEWWLTTQPPPTDAVPSPPRTTPDRAAPDL